MAEFDLSAILAGVSSSDTNGQEMLQYILYSDIKPDANNGYSMVGIEELARSIELVGLQQPLRVRRLDGGRQSAVPTGQNEESAKYAIVSGHRRHAAIGLLIEQGSKAFDGGVACIVDHGADSDAMQELKLLLANADNRKLTSADEAQQAERISDCIRRLEDEGYSFPGRHRDWVSKLSGMSRTKLARLSAIKSNLAPEIFKNRYQKGKMNETLAYELAGLSLENQRLFISQYQEGGHNLDYLHSSNVAEWKKLKDKFAKLKCPAKDHKGEPCSNQERLMKRCLANDYRYKRCKYENCCCAKCSDFVNCKYRCSLMDDKAKKERARVRADNKEIRDAEKAQQITDIEVLSRVWKRFGDALSFAGMKEKALRSRLKNKSHSFETYLNDKKIDALLSGSCTEIKQNDCLPFGYDYRVRIINHLCTLADALGVSLDYLFCRSDVPELGAAPEGAAAEDAGGKEARALPALWHRGTETPPEGVPVLTWTLTNAGEVYRAVIWDGSKYVDPKNGKKELTGFRCARWIEIPEDGSAFAYSIGWVPVVRGMPPDGKKVLTCDLEGDVDTDYVGSNGDFICGPVTHWMDRPPAAGEYGADVVSESDTAAEGAPGFRDGTPPRDGRYLCQVDMGLNALSEQQLDYKGGEWYAYGSPVARMMTVKAWYPLPDKKTVPAFEAEEKSDETEGD